MDHPFSCYIQVLRFYCNIIMHVYNKILIPVRQYGVFTDRRWMINPDDNGTPCLSALIRKFGDVFFISTTISYKLKSKSLKFEVPKVS